MLKDLVEAFTGQYKFKMDIASVRSSLRAIKKKVTMTLSKNMPRGDVK
jgi:hypothetical protein